MGELLTFWHLGHGCCQMSLLHFRSLCVNLVSTRFCPVGWSLESNVAVEYSPSGWQHEPAWEGCTAIYDTLMEIFDRSRSTDTPTHTIADQVAEERIFGA